MDGSMRRFAPLVWVAIVGCAHHAESGAPASPPPIPAPVRSQPLVAVPQHPVVPDLPPPSDTREGPAKPVFVPFGTVIGLTEVQAFWGAPSSLTIPEPVAHYQRFHETHRAAIGFGYLSILDLTIDERFLLVVSEEEAKLRTYEFPSLRPVTSIPVDGYAKFGRGDFVFWPSEGPHPMAIFAGPAGVVLSDMVSSLTLPLSPAAGDTMRWTDDHRVLGITESTIPEQRSRLIFYEPTGTNGLAPLLVLDFAERVEEWDLDSTKRRLAVVHYPSNRVMVFDLAERRVVWTAPVPEYSNSVDISNDDRMLAVGGSSLVVYDALTGMPRTGDGHFGNNIHRVRFSPSGDALAVSSYEGKLRIFDPRPQTPDLALVKTLRHTGTANVYAIAFTRDGRSIISGSGDQTVRVWGE